MKHELIMVDGNEAAARVAYQLSEVCAIYPITPSSTMAELADAWADEKQTNLWGNIPTVVEMQSEGGRPVRYTAPCRQGRSPPPSPPVRG